MSTRSQIGIYENSASIEKPTSIIYRHSDGYPEGKNGVIAVLMPFLKDFKSQRGDDTEYLAAQLVHRLIEKDKNHAISAGYYNKDSKYLGYGISNNIHSDIEYYYAIYPNIVIVFAVGNPDKKNTWTLINEIEY